MALDQVNEQIRGLSDRLKKSEARNQRLQGMAKDFDCLRRYLGDERVKEIIDAVKEQEVLEKTPTIKRDLAW